MHEIEMVRIQFNSQNIFFLFVWPIENQNRTKFNPLILSYLQKLFLSTNVYSIIYACFIQVYYGLQIKCDR